MPVLCPDSFYTKSEPDCKKWCIVLIDRLHDLHRAIVLMFKLFKRNKFDIVQKGLHQQIEIIVWDFCLLHQVSPVFVQFGLNIIRGVKGERIMQDNFSGGGILKGGPP